MKKNYKMMIQYDGSRFYGWQRQPDQDTVQGRMENVLARMCGGEQIETIGAGRTDAGVHAKGMVANVVMETSLSVEEIRDYLNQYLPDDIAVTEVRVASDRFHARYNAIRVKFSRYKQNQILINVSFDTLIRIGNCFPIR